MTTFDLLVTLFTFKDIDSMFWGLFSTFRNSTCHQLFNVTIARLSNTSFGFPSMLNKGKKVKILALTMFLLDGNNRRTNIDSGGGLLRDNCPAIYTT